MKLNSLVISSSVKLGILIAPDYFNLLCGMMFSLFSTSKACFKTKLNNWVAKPFGSYLVEFSAMGNYNTARWIIALVLITETRNAKVAEREPRK